MVVVVVMGRQEAVVVGRQEAVVERQQARLECSWRGVAGSASSRDRRGVPDPHYRPQKSYCISPTASLRRRGAAQTQTALPRAL